MPCRRAQTARERPKRFRKYGYGVPGFINLGIVIMSVSLLMFLIYFPDKGGMLVKAGGLGSYDPQIIKPAADMRGADQMNYDDVKPTTKTADA